MPFLALAFTGKEKLEAYLEHQSLSLLVVGESMELKGITVPMVYFSSEKGRGKEYIYRYQKAGALLQEVLIHFERHMPVKKQGECAVYGISSAVGRSGKTRLALELCRQIPGSLYIGMETYNSLSYQNHSLGNFLYELMQCKEECVEQMQELLVPFHESYVLPSPDCACDLRTLDAYHLEWFLKLLKSREHYTAIILDVGVGVLESPECFGVCDRLLFLVRADSTRHVESMERGWKRLGYQQLIERLEYCELPEEEEELAQYVTRLRKGL